MTVRAIIHRRKNTMSITELQATSIEGATAGTAGGTTGGGGQTKKVSGITLFASEGRAIPSSGWKDVPGKLKQVSVGTRDQVWGVNSDGNIRNFRNGTWETPPGAQIAGSITCVSVAEDGAVWAVNSDGNVYRRDVNAWTPVPTDKVGEKLAQISVRSADEVWGVGSDGDVYQWTKDSSWNPVPGDELAWVSAAQDGTVWGVSPDGRILHRDRDKDKETWTTISGGKLSKISVGSASRVYGVNAEGAIFRWTGRDWGKVDGTLGSVAVATDGTLWGVKPDGGVQYYLHAAPLVVSGPRLSEEALEQGGTAPYQFSVTNTAPGTVLTDLKLQLRYDEKLFEGITVQKLENVPAELVYGRTVTLYVKLTATARTKPGPYGFFGVDAEYTVNPTDSVPVSSDSGGWMTFNVVGVL